MATKSDKEEAIKRVMAKHGDGYDYKLRKKSFVDLEKLKKNQSVCSAGMKGYHILMTEK